MDDDAWLSQLNPEQLRAATYCNWASHAEVGPLLIIAGAGSGKTNTLAHRVAFLIAHGADPRRILLLTFSPRGGPARAADPRRVLLLTFARRAAAEMSRRVERIVASSAPGLGAHMAHAALTW